MTAHFQNFKLKLSSFELGADPCRSWQRGRGAWYKSRGSGDMPPELLLFFFLVFSCSKTASGAIWGKKFAQRQYRQLLKIMTFYCGWHMYSECIQLGIQSEREKGGVGGGGHPNQEIEDYTTKLLGDGAERANINIDLRQVYMLN